MHLEKLHNFLIRKIQNGKKLLADKDTYLTDKPVGERHKQLWKAYLIIAVLFIFPHIHHLTLNRHVVINNHDGLCKHPVEFPLF